MKNMFTVMGNKTIPNNFVNLPVTKDKPHNNSKIFDNGAGAVCRTVIYYDYLNELLRITQAFDTG